MQTIQVFIKNSSNSRVHSSFRQAFSIFKNISNAPLLLIKFLVSMKNEILDFVLFIVHKTWALQSDVVCVCVNVDCKTNIWGK